MNRKKQIYILTILFVIFLTIVTVINMVKNNAMSEKSSTETYANSLYSEIILPVGSTSDDLQVAIDNATSGDNIIISSDIIYTTTTPTVEISVDKVITIQSDTGNNWILSQSKASTRHFKVDGTLTLQDITLEGNDSGGGVTVNSNAIFNMNDNTTIQNCYNYDGGAVRNYGMFSMYEATIEGCSGGNGGAVRCEANGQFDIYGGTITNNSASIGGAINITYLR